MKKNSQNRVFEKIEPILLAKNAFLVKTNTFLEKTNAFLINSNLFLGNAFNCDRILDCESGFFNERVRTVQKERILSVL